MTYTSYFRKSLKILSMIENVDFFVLDKDSLYDPKEIEMMIDVLCRLDFIVKNSKGFVISDKGRNVLSYFKDELEPEIKPIQNFLIE